MPIDIQIDESKNSTIFTVVGNVSFDDLMNAVKAFYANPTKNALWNYNPQTKSENTFSNDEVEKILKYVISRKKVQSEEKTAYVVSSDVTFDMERMSRILNQIMNLTLKMMVFRSMDDAVEWIA